MIDLQYFVGGFHGEDSTAHVDEHGEADCIDELELPAGAQIGAIVREGPGVDLKPAREVIIPHHDTIIRSGDHVIVFVPRKRMVRQVEKVFQVSATFF